MCVNIVWCCIQMDGCVHWVCALGTSLGILSSYLCPQPSNRLWFLAPGRLSPSTQGSSCHSLALSPAGQRPSRLPYQEAWGGGQGQAKAGPELMANFPGPQSIQQLLQSLLAVGKWKYPPSRALT